MSEKVKKPFWRRWWFWTIAVILFIGAVSNGEEETKGTQSNVQPTASSDTPAATGQESGKKEESPATPAPAPAPVATPEEFARTVFHKAFGEKNLYDDGDSIEQLAYNSENGLLTIRVFARDNLTEKMIKKGIWMNTHTALKELRSRDEIKEVQFNILMPLQDAYGNTSNSEVVKATFTAETRGKINWDNFMWDRIPVVADEYWEHPVIKRIET